MSSRQPAPVSSPCISVCRMDEGTGWCVGCLRTIDEIIAWGQMAEPERRRVMAGLSARRLQWRTLRRDRAAAADRAHTDGDRTDSDHTDNGAAPESP